MNKLERKQLRLKLLDLMNEEEDWMNDEKRVQKIQNLASSLTQRETSNLKKRSWENFSRSEFLYLLTKGLYSKDIMELYQVSNSKLLAWRRMHGFTGKTPAQILQENYKEVQQIVLKKKGK